MSLSVIGPHQTKSFSVITLLLLVTSSLHVVPTFSFSTSPSIVGTNKRYNFPCKIESISNTHSTVTKTCLDAKYSRLPSFHSANSHRQGRTKHSQTALQYSQKDDIFDGKTTFTLIGAQSLLIVASVIAALILGTPNYGLGSDFHIDTNTLVTGSLYTIPLFVLAYVLDFVEKDVPSLQDVTRATQRSVLALLGSRRKPLIALVTAIALGIAAGIGEEMLFRGVLQTSLSSRFGSFVGIGFSSILFGTLHAVTPLYAALATLASVFFGVIFGKVGNLAVVMVCHGLYDVGALLWAHWTVTGMTDEERLGLLES